MAKTMTALVTALKNLLTGKKYGRTVLLMNIAPWKRELFNSIYRDCNVVVIPIRHDALSYEKIVRRSKTAELVVWGYRESRNTNRLVKKCGLRVTRVEDGFIRSFGLGIEHNLPRSLCFDDEGLYYNARKASRFERLAQNHKTAVTPELLERARKLRAEFCRTNITKYNLRTEKLSYGPKTRPRILVIGQCENDVSIRCSLSEITTNLGLAKFAKERNPGAEIVFKQHPDEAHKKIGTEKIAAVADTVITRSVPINELLEGVDRVYTICSLLGLEALLRGREVYVTGMPFYAGWGLTHDLISCPRRTEKLTADELFAIAYLLYPVYFDEHFNRVDAAEFISSFIAGRVPETPGTAPSGNAG